MRKLGDDFNSSWDSLFVSLGKACIPLWKSLTLGDSDSDEKISITDDWDTEGNSTSLKTEPWQKRKIRPDQLSLTDVVTCW